MELRVLQYFLAVTREQSISGAAEALHLSQPTLSRQLRDMEEELGKQLFVRSNRRITLTEEGMILRKRAEEILELVQKAEDEITAASAPIAGSITVGAGELDGVRILPRAIQRLREKYPLVHLHIVSGDRVTVTEELDRGLIDFGLLFGVIDTTKYSALKVPCTEHYGVLMRKDSPLAKYEILDPKELWDKPLIVSRQSLHDETVADILHSEDRPLNIAGSYNLLFNGSLMVEEGMGYALGLDRIINVSGNSPLTFRPLKDQTPFSLHLVWKKYQHLTKAAEKFLETISELLAPEP